MVATLYVFLASTTLLVLVSLFTQAELRRGKRFFLVKFRTNLDNWFIIIYRSLVAKIRYVVRHTFQLSWYYSIHSALRAVLTLLVKIYDRLELVFINNKERARVLRIEKREMTEKNHLSEIEAHKVANALSPAQKKKLKAKKLAGD
jgi:hypothetical protein